MSLKRKLNLDDDDGTERSSLTVSAAATAASTSTSSSAAATAARTVPGTSLGASKRPRLHEPATNSHRHGLQRPTDARPRSSSAPCPPTIRTQSDKFVYPPWMPDVTRESLRSLDLDVLQTNVQFRHDFLLDGPHKFTRVIAKPKRDDVTRYWLAVLIELETGCTCVAFDEENKVYPCVCPDHKSGKMPSRVLPMLAELRCLIRHVTAPARPTAAPADQPDELTRLLDEHQIRDAIRLGVYDPVPLFRYVGQTLKEHCAPMRDARIDAMVAYACDRPQQPTTSSVIKNHLLQAIRMCFDVVELMAMDIANHQLLTFRPRLLCTTASMEFAAFSTKFRLHESPTMPIPCAQAALQRSLEAVRQSHAPSSTTTREQQLRAALTRTVVDLIFSPSVLAGPRAPGSRIPVDFPETLYLDHSRLSRFGMEAADLSVLYMLLILSRSPPFSVSDQSTASALKSELISISPPRLGLCFGHALRAARHSKSLSHSDPAAVSAKLEDEQREWRRGVSDVLLQIARRAVPPGGVPSQSVIDTLERWADTNLREGSAFASVLQRRLKDAFCDAIELAARSQSASQVQVNTASMYAQQPCAQTLMLSAGRQSTPATLTSPHALNVRLMVPKAVLPQSVTGAGLEPLADEIMALARRISDVVTHHWNVFNPIYSAPGFLQ